MLGVMNDKFRSRRPEVGSRRRRAQVPYVHTRRANGISHLRLNSLAPARSPSGASGFAKTPFAASQARQVEPYRPCDLYLLTHVRLCADICGYVRLFRKKLLSRRRVGARGLHGSGCAGRLEFHI
jgi:hypothetical protein